MPIGELPRTTSTRARISGSPLRVLID